MPAKVLFVSKKARRNIYNKKSLTAIRAGLDQHLRSPPLNKPFSVIGDPLFTEANKTLSNYLKTLSKRGDIAPTVHKQALTKEVVEKLYDDGELVEFDTLNPAKLQQTAWFFISLFLGKRGRENQQTMKKTMPALRKTSAGEEYYEVSNGRGAVLATKNHQGGLNDQDDESNGKIFERPGSKRCPVKLISKYLRHLNPESSNLFQRPRSPCKSFNPAKDEVWFCSVPLGHNSLENMLRGMTSRAGIQPYLTNHSIRATTVTVLSAANYESGHIKAITGHQSKASIESCSNTSTFHQFKSMSNAIADFVDPGCSSADPSASLVAESSRMTAASSFIHSTLASLDENNARKSVEIQQSQKNSQHLVHGLIPGGTFQGCTFNFTVNLPGSSSQQDIQGLNCTFSLNIVSDPKKNM